ncbi:mannose-6-phosphate isomerase, class I [Leucobacter sp. HY1910]
MLIFIENTPRAYAWGSTDALPEMLGTAPTGQPQAELWLGTHPGSPAHIAKATPAPHTVIDLVETDPERYGVDGGPLPFLLKVLAIGAPLSLQVHPNRAQAAAGFAAEEAAGVPRDARERNYGDANHKPELLVALSEVSALSGFRPLAHARDDLARYVRAAGEIPDPAAAAALHAVAGQLCPGAEPASDAEVRRAFLAWVFSGDAVIARALAGLEALAAATEPGQPGVSLAGDRDLAMRALVAAHPGDPGVLVSLLLHHVRLQPGESIYLGARQLHAYLGGIGVEVMAASDNVLRAGLTEKHVDIAELTRVLDTEELAEPRFTPVRVQPGLDAWRPEIDDFELLRATLCEPEDDSEVHECHAGAAKRVLIDVPAPAVLVVTRGRVRIERVEAAPIAEVAAARRGQSLYVSAGEPIELTGHGEVFLATVGGGGAGGGGGVVGAGAGAGAVPQTSRVS